VQHPGTPKEFTPFSVMDECGVPHIAVSVLEKAADEADRDVCIGRRIAEYRARYLINKAVQSKRDSLL
jgi:hypothetical protein